MSDAPVIDPEAINNLRALGADDDDSFLKEIVGLYLQDTPTRLTELRSSFAEGDVSKFTRAAHSMKGSSSNLGAMRVRAVAERLEYAAKQKGLDGLDALLPEIEREFEAARSELAKLLG